MSCLAAGDVKPNQFGRIDGIRVNVAPDSAMKSH